MKKIIIQKTLEEAQRDLVALAHSVSASDSEVRITDKQGNLLQLALVAKATGRVVNGRPVYKYEDAEKLGVPPP